MKIEAILGFAQASGRLVSGDRAVTHRLQRGQVYVVLLARDGGERTRRRYQYLCEQADVPLLTWGTKEQLGRILGRPQRSVLGVTDRKFARMLQEALAGGPTG